MKRVLLSLVALVALAGVACSGGDKKPAATATEPAAESTSAPAKDAASTPEASGDGADPIGSIFSTLFDNSALNLSPGTDGGAAPEFGPGDESLKQYLLTADDIPAGYSSMGEFSYRVPDGISKEGGMDMAASMFTSGDPESSDPSGATIVMSMVLRPDDLTELGAAFDQAKGMSEEDLRDAIAQGAGGFGGADMFKVKLLDADGLGDGGFGMELTMDLSGLLGAFAEGFGADESAQADVEKMSKIVMRMYVFATGDYAGGVIRMAFSETLPGDVDELKLAKVVARRLAEAP